MTEPIPQPAPEPGPADAPVQSGSGDSLLDEQTRRWQQGDRVLVEELLAQWPDLALETEALLDLIYNEVVLRERQADSPQLDEYVARFPVLSPRLREQFEVHRALRQADYVTDGPSVARSAPGSRTIAPQSGTPQEGCTDRTMTLGAAAKGTSPVDWPKVLQGYEIVAQIGRGGMGVVFKAWQTKLRRLVALKMLRDGALANRGDLDRFHTEAEAIARLQHPHIVQIFEIGGKEGGSYFVMELVDGVSLDRKLAGQPQPVREAAALVETLARAMHYAHERGVIHRDLKPANVLVAADGQPKITDFGLAKLVAGGPEHTQSGSILGTPNYMAPEQASGKNRSISPATDVYALGAILYELLTGRPPFKGESSLETLSQVIAAQPVAPSRLRPALARDVETICLKCLAKDPVRRYASAQALAEDLHRFIQGEPIVARPAGRVERAARWANRNPVVAGLGAALLVVLIGSFLAITWKWLDAESQRQLAEDRANSEEQEKQKARAAELAALEAQVKADAAERLATGRANELEKTLYQHTIARTYQELLANHPARAEQLLSQCQPAFRAWEWRFLQRACQTHLLALGAGEPVALGVAYSPDGRYLASCGGKSENMHHPGAVRLWDAVSGKVHRVLLGHTGWVHAVAFSPDGRRLASVGADRTLRLWDVDTGDILRTCPGHADRGTAVAFSPDGKRIASAGDSGQVRIWDPDTGAQLLALDAATGTVRAVAFSPDSKGLAAAGRLPPVVRIWDAQTGRLIQTLKGHAADVFGVAYHPDGRLASASWDGTVKVWDTAGRALGTTIANNDLVSAVAFSPTGNWLVSGSFVDGSIRIYNGANAQLIRTIHAHTGSIYSLAVSADGRCVASAGEDGMIRVWDPELDQDGGSVNVGYIWAGQLAFDKNSKWVAIADRIPEALDHKNGPVAIRAFPSCALLRTVGTKNSVANGIAASPSSEILAIASTNKTVQLWSAETGQLLKELAGHDDAVTGVAFAADGNSVASVGKDATLRIWDVRAGREIFTMRDPAGPLYAIACSPRGPWLACGGQGNVVQLWDAHVRSKRRDLDAHTAPVKSLAFSPDGTLLASCGDDSFICVWDIASGREVHRLHGHASRIATIAFSPDGRRLVSASPTDRSVKVWDTAEGKELLSLEAQFAYCAAFSPDGSHLVAGRNLTLRVWEATEFGAAAKAIRLQLSASASQADFRMARRDWAQAADALSKAIESGLDDTEDQCSHAAVLLLAGREEQYRQACRKLVKRYGDTKDAHTAYNVARVCALDMIPPIDADQLLQLAGRAVNISPGTPWYRYTIGLAHVRAGNHRQAIGDLQKLASDSPAWTGQPANWLVIALCLHHQGMPDEAGKWLAKAVKWMDRDVPAMPWREFRLRVHLHDWLGCQFLRAEVERLIGGKREGSDE
jgi:WD40 repeat protein